MNTIVVNGLKVTTKCRYIKFTESSSVSVSENIVTDVFEIKFPNGFLSSELYHKNIEFISDTELVSTRYIKILNPITTINGVTIKLLTSQDFIFNQYIVSDIEEFVMDYYIGGLSILVPKIKDAKFDEYVEVLSHCPYIEIVSVRKSILKNYYQVNLLNSSGVINSLNDFVFNIKANYNRYLLSDVMVVSSFKDQLSSILSSYGMQLIRYPIDQNSNTPNRLIYRISEYGTQVSHKTGYDSLRDQIQHKTTIDFELSCVDLDIFNDFRARYQNIDLVSNFTEFFTKDKRGVPILSNVRWGPIPTDFNPDYPQDNQGNSAYSTQFNCELRYYIQYDKMFITIQGIIVELLHTYQIRTGGRLGDQIGEIDRADIPLPDEGEFLEIIKVEQDKDIPEWQKLREMS